MSFFTFILLSFMIYTQAAIVRDNYYPDSQAYYNNNNYNANNYYQTSTSFPLNHRKEQIYTQSSNYHHNQAGVVRTSSEQAARTLHNEQELNPDGSYSYSFETSNGISASEHSNGNGVVQGTSSYISPEGIEIKMSYVADENGFHPVGDHIPKTPDYILKALEYIKNHPYQEKNYYNGATKQANIEPKVGVYSQGFSTAKPPYRTTSRPYNNINYYQTTTQTPFYYTNPRNEYRPQTRGNFRYFNY